MTNRCGLQLLAFLALLLMHEYSLADTSAEPQNPNQQAENTAVPDTPETAESGLSAVEPEGTTEELIAGRGYQKFQYKGLSFAPGGFWPERRSFVLPTRMPMCKVRLATFPCRDQRTVICGNFGGRPVARG